MTARAGAPTRACSRPRSRRTWATGPRLKAYAVGLAQGHFVGLERVCEIVADPCGVQPSGWSVQQWIVKAGQLLAPRYEAGRLAVISNTDQGPD